MKKLTLSTALAALVLSSVSFAATTTTNTPKPPQDHDKFHQAMSECMSAAGIEKPSEPPKAPNGKAGNGEQPPAPPSGQNGQGNQGKPAHHKHPEMTDAQRQKVDSCMSAKGFERPKDMPKDGSRPPMPPQGNAPQNSNQSK